MKKLVKYLLTMLLVLSFCITALANDQLPVDEFEVDNVYYVIGEDITTGEAIITPTVTVSWEDPDSWAYDTEIHEPDFYEIIVDNVTFDEEDAIIVTENDDAFTSKTVDIHDEVNLETGSLYKMSIQPFHYHESEVDGETVKELADNTGDAEIVYAITDLDVEFEADEDSIQIIWDDVGESEIEYRIVYAIGDYSDSSKSELIDNKEGEITGLTSDSDDVTSFYDSSSNRQKLSYTIDSNVYPGQIYSVMVEPTTQYFDGETISRNINYPYIRSVSTDIVLSLTEEGDYLRLSWDVPSSFQVGQSQEEYSLVQGTITETQDGTTRNLVIFDAEAAAIGYYRITKPIWETEYQLTLEYEAVDDTSKEAITPVSNIVTYSPSEYYIQPTIPYIPDLLSQTILDEYEENYTASEVYEILEEKHFVPDYTYSDDIDDLLAQEVTFHVNADNTYINFVWGAFERIDVDETSSTYGDYIYDTNVYYDIWVTDQLETLAYAEAIIQDERYSSSSSDYVILDSTDQIVGFKQQLGTYYSTDDNEIVDMTPGKLYYIKVVAKKINANDTLESEPNIVSVYYGYDGDSFEPPMITKPPLQEKKEDTDTTGVTIIWRESWSEIISSDSSETGVLADWQYEIWADINGNVYDEYTTDTQYFPIYNGEEEIEAFENYMSSIGHPVSLITKTVDLGKDAFGVSDISYDFVYIRYQSVLDAIKEAQEKDSDYDFTDYYNDLIVNDKDGTAPISWNTINPTTDTDDEAYLAYRQENLVANTSYMFVLYPYRTLDDDRVLYSHYPAYIIVTTKPEEVTPSPDPTVPALYTTDITETSITLTWKYNTDFTYELIYSTEDNESNAKPLEFQIPADTSDEDYPVDGDYYKLVVDDLFPLTTYYFWIRAVQTDDNTTSSWSNPALGTTSDVDEPQPPRGLGLASASTREIYDYDLSVSEDHMILEWILDPDDDYDDVDVTETETDITWSYSYILEVADNSKFIDPLYIVSTGGGTDTVPDTVTILDKNVVLIEALVGNRYYYARAKTILTVTSNSLDKSIKRESESYTEAIRIITLSTGDEYDGTIDPALTILPSEDYELIYNETGKSLEFRFRTDEIDEDGNSDNQVDQRLISRLIEDGTHEYIIDLQSYSDQDVERRRVIIPHSVMEAFDIYDINVRIEADDINITVPAEGVSAYVEDQVEDYGISPTLVIDMERLDEEDILEELPESSLASVSVPQEMQITVKSSRRSEAVDYTDEAMTMEMHTESRYKVYDKDVVVYIKDDRAKWSVSEGTYDSYEAAVVFETSKVGTYGVFVHDRSDTVENNIQPNHWSEDSRVEVFSKITIEGIDNYIPDSNVPESVLLQAIYGTVMNQSTIDLSETLDSGSVNTLYRAGIIGDTDQSSTSITREEAISIFGRAAEIYSGSQTDTDNALIAEVAAAGISEAYVENVAKAKYHGLISNTDDLRPWEKITYGEFFALWARMLS